MMRVCPTNNKEHVIMSKKRRIAISIFAVTFLVLIAVLAASVIKTNAYNVYRKKLSKDYILEELEKNKGRQFDPEIAEIMLRLLREDKLPSISETIPNNA
jgi:uncharacterized membrane protein SpoIIM required for sporulation